MLFLRSVPCRLVCILVGMFSLYPPVVVVVVSVHTQTPISVRVRIVESVKQQEPVTPKP